MVRRFCLRGEVSVFMAVGDGNGGGIVMMTVDMVVVIMVIWW